MSLADASVRSEARPVPRPTIGILPVVTVALGLFIIWMPLQTPIALVAFQYGHSIAAARALLLIKDVVAAALILVLLARYWRRIDIYWFDWAAIVYLAFMVIYSVGPWLLGSHITILSVVSTARDYVVPVELYGLGRLAFAAGVDIHKLMRWFMVVAAVAAIYTLATDLLPQSFWYSTMNMVEFVKQVQGVSSAASLWDVSIIASYGSTFQVFTRAIGPFTHPVGTGTYFMLPLSLAIAWCFEAVNKGRKRDALALLALTVLFAAAVITPISRGSWIGAGLALVVCAVVYRRFAFSLAALALTGAVLFAVVPYNFAITSAVDQTDSSTQDHAAAITKATTAVTTTIAGKGVGQADQFGQMFSGGEGVGENMYLALWVSVGPIGLLAFLVFMVGLVWRLAAARFRAPPPSWMVIGSGAALVGFAASAMTSSTLMRFTTSGSIWLVMGLCAAYAVAQKRSGRSSAPGTAEVAADSSTPDAGAPQPAA